jgi:hypothetical protein
VSKRGEPDMAGRASGGWRKILWKHTKSKIRQGAPAVVKVHSRRSDSLLGCPRRSEGKGEVHVASL